jgi:hypothetical protein
MIYPAQIEWSFQSLTYSLPRPFSDYVLYRAHIAFYAALELLRDAGSINFTGKFPWITHCIEANKSSNCWTNSNRANSNWRIAVCISLCPCVVRLNYIMSLTICWKLSWDWTKLSLTTFERLPIASALATVTASNFLTYVSWLVSEWAKSEFLDSSSLSTLCSSIFKTVAVPKAFSK